MNEIIGNQVREDFNKAKTKAQLGTILKIVRPHSRHLFSLQDIKEIVKPEQESYKGLQVVEVRSIVGSEERYQDFSMTFLPKKEHLRHRWESIDQAHLQDVILPPIRLFKIGDIYFVRDGNHRVSVARSQGVEAIDAEVVELGTQIKITAGMSFDEIEKKVVEHERDVVINQYDLESCLPMDTIRFTKAGRYEEFVKQIEIYRTTQNMKAKEAGTAELAFDEAAREFYSLVYRPVSHLMKSHHLMQMFPQRMEADLFLWVVRHANLFSLDESTGDGEVEFSRNISQAIESIYSENPWQRFLANLLSRFSTRKK